MIHDGVELPRLLTVEKAAEILTTSEAAVRDLIAHHEIQSVRLNGTVHVVTDSIADRLDVRTESRHNQDCD